MYSMKKRGRDGTKGKKRAWGTQEVVIKADELVGRESKRAQKRGNQRKEGHK